ncbi:MAG: hypothetical protein ACOX4I_09370 [Anaerovoracaceae bacterium]|jgi:hypothetical protein
MKCGVKFCGGCNPHYQRGEALKTLKERLPDVEFKLAEEGEVYDYLLVIGGCTACCASFEQYTTKNGVVKMWDADQIDRVQDKITEVANNIK